MTRQGATPKISVIIPAYNRREMLRQALESLAEQSVHAGEFEVIVADDGSSDGTAELVASCEGLRPRYHFQEDQGFRVAAARNAGARLARAPLLSFLDAGTVPGPDFVRAHLAAHPADQPPDAGHAVIGYCFGYRPFDGSQWPAGELDSLGAAGVMRRHAADLAFLDARHQAFEKAGFDVGGMTAPWFLFWGMNCSVSASAFWRAGGFDEAYRSWGVEDTELGYRLFRRGATFLIGREAWAIEVPQGRRLTGNRQSMLRNARYFLRKHPDPVVEIAGDALRHPDLWLVESGAAALADWTATAGPLDVRAELRHAALDIAPGSSVAIFGCGGSVPAGLPPSVLIDFDSGLLAVALADGRHTGHHAIGLRTPLGTGSVDEVIVTSRLGGLWDRWGDLIAGEAHRVGGRVRGPMF
jgi:glycosyltransferase involved in cell wall biosynthesis